MALHQSFSEILASQNSNIVSPVCETYIVSSGSCLQLWSPAREKLKLSAFWLTTRIDRGLHLDSVLNTSLPFCSVFAFQNLGCFDPFFFGNCSMLLNKYLIFTIFSSHSHRNYWSVASCSVLPGNRNLSYLYLNGKKLMI